MAKPVVYLFYVADKPYIGQTFDLEKRWSQHLAHKGKNPMYKVWSNVIPPIILYTYDGKSEHIPYIRSVLKKKESEFIKQYNSFLNGWNQQIANEKPSETIQKYILDYKLTKNPKLKQQLLWKINNVNISGRTWSNLFKQLQ